MMDMAQRLADAGYVVLLPDLFYRYGSYGPFVPAEVFKGDYRAILGPLMAAQGRTRQRRTRAQSSTTWTRARTCRAAAWARSASAWAAA